MKITTHDNLQTITVNLAIRNVVISDGQYKDSVHSELLERHYFNGMQINEVIDAVSTIIKEQIDFYGEENVGCFNCNNGLIDGCIHSLSIYKSLELPDCGSNDDSGRPGTPMKLHTTTYCGPMILIVGRTESEPDPPKTNRESILRDMEDALREIMMLSPNEGLAIVSHLNPTPKVPLRQMTSFFQSTGDSCN